MREVGRKAPEGVLATWKKWTYFLQFPEKGCPDPIDLPVGSQYNRGQGKYSKKNSIPQRNKKNTWNTAP